MLAKTELVPFNFSLVCGCADIKRIASVFCRYREHVVWGDKDLRLKLLRKGILTRIYAPMVRMAIGILENKNHLKSKLLF